jgi:hypothetical protein
MNFKCLCGTSLNNNACPNEIEHLLISAGSQESLQNLVDEEVEANGEVNLWPEHWEDSKSIIVWKCYECGRLYIDAEGDPEKVVVYQIEQQGIEAERRTSTLYRVTPHPTIADSNTVELKSVVWQW